MRINAFGADVRYILTVQRNLFMDYEHTEFITPARQLANEIIGMNLFIDDAELLLNLARCLCSPS